MSELALPSQEYLNSILEYDQNTGKLIWKCRADRNKCWHTKYANKNAGYIVFKNKDYPPYMGLTIDGKAYLAHRIIWKIIYGEDPLFIDHINGDGTDNHLSNIRNINATINQRNKKMHRNNSSGVTGVFKDNVRNKWIAVNSDTKKHKRFNRIEDAILYRNQYLETAKFFTKRHGEK